MREVKKITVEYTNGTSKVYECEGEQLLIMVKDGTDINVTTHLRGMDIEPFMDCFARTLARVAKESLR